MKREWIVIMKRNLIVATIFVIVAMFPRALVAQDPDAGVLYHPSRGLVRFKPAVVATAKSAAHAQVQALQVLHQYHNDEALQLVEVPEGSVLNAVATYMSNPDALNAEPNYIYHISQTTPNDIEFGQQYGMHNNGRGGTVGSGQNVCHYSVSSARAWHRPERDVHAP